MGLDSLLVDSRDPTQVSQPWHPSPSPTGPSQWSQLVVVVVINPELTKQAQGGWLANPRNPAASTSQHWDY